MRKIFEISTRPKGKKWICTDVHDVKDSKALFALTDTLREQGKIGFLVRDAETKSDAIRRVQQFYEDADPLRQDIFWQHKLFIL